MGTASINNREYTLCRSHMCCHWPKMKSFHYCDTIMTKMASRNTNLTVVHSIVYSDADQRKHQSSAWLAFVWEFTGTGEFPAQRASYAEDVSIWWRHHVQIIYVKKLQLILRLCSVILCFTEIVQENYVFNLREWYFGSEIMIFLWYNWTWNHMFELILRYICVLQMQDDMFPLEQFNTDLSTSEMKEVITLAHPYKIVGSSSDR